jgi:hypothetical protein
MSPIAATKPSRCGRRCLVAARRKAACSAQGCSGAPQTRLEYRRPEEAPDGRFPPHTAPRLDLECARHLANAIAPRNAKGAISPRRAPRLWPGPVTGDGRLTRQRRMPYRRVPRACAPATARTRDASPLAPPPTSCGWRPCPDPRAARRRCPTTDRRGSSSVPSTRNSPLLWLIPVLAVVVLAVVFKRFGTRPDERVSETGSDGAGRLQPGRRTCGAAGSTRNRELAERRSTRPIGSIHKS